MDFTFVDGDFTFIEGTIASPAGPSFDAMVHFAALAALERPMPYVHLVHTHA